MDMLSERSRKVLYAVVQSYIIQPDPVGSRTITKRYPFGLSPATIRNIMADLEEMGFLKQPHTSAGRVPTDLGYRFYVDSLVTEGEIYSNLEILLELQRKLDMLKNDIDSLLSETTRSLSMMSQYIGVAMSPSPDMTTLKKLNLFKYRPDRIAVVLFTDEGMVKNKIIAVDSNITQKDLNRISAYINSEFSGFTLDEIRTRIVRELSREKARCDNLIAHALEICKEALYFTETSLFVSGLSGLLDLPDFTDLDKIRQLSKAIEDKHTIIGLLDEIAATDGVQVIIGSENATDEMKKLSIIVSPCKEEGRPIGVVGLIGPTRMNYAKAIYIVENTAHLITQMLSER
jgi:heat-inducible transcriptional repressor